jgi:adenosine deaminase
LSGTREWLRLLPKAELHVHLEGTVTPQTFRRIAARHKMSVPDDVASLFRCDDFDSFLAAWLVVVKALRDPQDFADIAAEYLATSAHNGVRHIEFFFSPATIRHFNKGVDLVGIVQAIAEAARAANKSSGISALVILDMVRNLGEDAALADIDLAQHCAQLGVVGIGLGGDERRFPAMHFAKPFARAAKLGLRRTAHAGEAAGPHSVRDAIELLGAERVGHAVSAAYDETTLQLIAQKKIGVDSCLTSNRITGASPAGAEHPLQTFLARGINVTLNSDDPAFFGAGLIDEYESAARAGVTKEQLATLARNSFAMSFAPQPAQERWCEELEKYVASP